MQASTGIINQSHLPSLPSSPLPSNDQRNQQRTIDTIDLPCYPQGSVPTLASPFLNVIAANPRLIATAISTQQDQLPQWHLKSPLPQRIAEDLMERMRLISLHKASPMNNELFAMFTNRTLTPISRLDLTGCSLNDQLLNELLQEHGRNLLHLNLNQLRDFTSSSLPNITFERLQVLNFGSQAGLFLQWRSEEPTVDARSEGLQEQLICGHLKEEDTKEDSKEEDTKEELTTGEVAQEEVTKEESTKDVAMEESVARGKKMQKKTFLSSVRSCLARAFCCSCCLKRSKRSSLVQNETSAFRSVVATSHENVNDHFKEPAEISEPPDIKQAPESLSVEPPDESSAEVFRISSHELTAACPNLRSFSIDGCMWGVIFRHDNRREQSSAFLRDLLAPIRPVALNLTNWRDLNPEEVFADHLVENLQALCLFNSTSASKMEVLIKFQNLRFLDISRPEHYEGLWIPYQPPAGTLFKLMQSLPCLESLDISGTNLTAPATNADPLPTNLLPTNLPTNHQQNFNNTISGLFGLHQKLKFLGIFDCPHIQPDDQFPAEEVASHLTIDHLLTAIRHYETRSSMNFFVVQLIREKVAVVASWLQHGQPGPPPDAQFQLEETIEHFRGFLEIIRRNQNHYSARMLDDVSDIVNNWMTVAKTPQANLDAENQKILRQEVIATNLRCCEQLLNQNSAQTLPIAAQFLSVLKFEEVMMPLAAKFPPKTRRICLVLHRRLLDRLLDLTFPKDLEVCSRLSRLKFLEVFVKEMKTTPKAEWVEIMELGDEQLLPRILAFSTKLLNVLEKSLPKLQDTWKEVAIIVGLFNFVGSLVVGTDPTVCQQFLDNNGLKVFSITATRAAPSLLRTNNITACLAELYDIRAPILREDVVRALICIVRSALVCTQSIYNASKLLVRFLMDRCDFWKDKEDLRNSATEALVIMVPIWPLGTVVLHEQQPFQHLELIFHVRNSEPSVQLWALWSLRNVIKLDPKTYERHEMGISDALKHVITCAKQRPDRVSANLLEMAKSSLPALISLKTNQLVQMPSYQIISFNFTTL